jgi:hypothetical protein
LNKLNEKEGDRKTTHSEEDAPMEGKLEATLLRTQDTCTISKTEEKL